MLVRPPYELLAVSRDGVLHEQRQGLAAMCIYIYMYMYIHTQEQQ